jgi:carboxyl-terminal processing protease
MKQAPKNPSPINWFYMPLIAIVLAFGFLQLKNEKQNQRSRALPQIASESSVSNMDDLRDLSISLLTDSILSIVQSYYVDPRRVTNESLLTSGIESLENVPGISASIDENQVTIVTENGSHSFPLERPISYKNLVTLFRNMARYLDSVEALADGHPSDQSITSGSVTLLNHLLSALDAHSTLLSPEAYRELRQGTEGSFGGLGVLVGMRENVLTVIKPLPRSPAVRAGIRRFDKILGIDGVHTYGYTLDDLVEHMRGEPGTEVELSLLRNGADHPSLMQMKREIINVDSVESTDIVKDDSKILHMTIENFSSRTSTEVLTSIKEARARMGEVNGVVLDMRSNPGGLLDQAVQVVDLFIKSGVIVTTKGRHQEVETAGTGFDETDFPIVVLINEDSASASEIVAGALQDHGRAVVIGQPSFGKGSVQTIFELPGERALKLTIARYYTPLGRSIQNVGIIPDVWMQPIFARGDNTNLFGAYRYKNERFLKHHLSAKFDKKVKSDIAVQKGYYLAKEISQDSQKHEDRELNAALQVIRKVHATYGDVIPKAGARASHWLSLAAPELRKVLNSSSRQVASWLKKNHKVNWSRQSGDEAALNLAIDFPEGTSVKLGDMLEIPWEISNTSSRPITQASVFVRSEFAGFETQENLVGTIGAKGEKKGVLKIHVPTYLDPGPLVLRLGVAKGAWPVLHAVKTISVEVEDRPLADIRATVSLIDAGKHIGILESQEQAKVRIKLENGGESTANNLHVKLENISGSQVSLKGTELKISEIEVGETKTFDVEISGSKSIYSADLGLGIFVDSKDLRIPLAKRVSVRGLPNTPTQKVSNLIGH